MFRIVRSPAVPALLGTSSNVKCVKVILPTGRKIVSFNWPPVPILVVLKVTNIGTTKQLTKVTISIHTLQEEPDVVLRGTYRNYSIVCRNTILVVSGSKGLL